MQWQMQAILVACCICLVTLVSCTRQPETPQAIVETAVEQALFKIGMELDDISLPRLNGTHSVPGRLPIVDKSLQQPISMIGRSQQIANHGLHATTKTLLLSGLLEDLITDVTLSAFMPGKRAAVQNNTASVLPEKNNNNAQLKNILRRILDGINLTHQSWIQASGNPKNAELDSVRDHLLASINYQGVEVNPRLMTHATYHEMGARIEIKEYARAVLQLLATVEGALPDLLSLTRNIKPFQFMTPHGAVRVAGTGPDTHTGEYALLIDLGGNDRYQDAGQLPQPGHVSVLIDLSGDDTVQWKSVPGPGAGIFGISVWLDVEGHDTYRGVNMGLGVGLFGGGILWDMAGNDSYQSGSNAEGAGTYGIGVLLDENGDDTYSTALYGQGFGGPGGIGIQLDLQGDDRYTCGGLVPDKAQDRIARHKKVHYLSMCQGFGFGIRPHISGGAGLLLDMQGNDQYLADLFAQGSAYWFGLGMLVDYAGDDHYKAFEHCQGEALHLAAGFLGDWGGDDRYNGHEHCQGIGIDRSAGLLYEHAGNDRFKSRKFSQGAGLKPFGVGLLVEVAGDDHYSTKRNSQGISFKPTGFPDSQWPTGILLDMAGKDIFDQPVVAPIYTGGRVQNKQGIAIDQP